MLCSTGLSKEDEAELEKASASVPVFRSANMSVGINVLIELARRATRLFGGEFDIEIVEKHHHNKLDAPSGTALMIADAINAEANGAYEYVYDRHQVRQKRGKQELGISSVRRRHRGRARGAVLRAGGGCDPLPLGPEPRRLRGRSCAGPPCSWTAHRPGFYTMTDMLRGKLQCL